MKERKSARDETRKDERRLSQNIRKLLTMSSGI